MIEDEDRSADEPQAAPAANDNGNGDARPRIDAAVLRIARLIGRQMAREEFERLSAANDNRMPERNNEIYIGQLVWNRLRHVKDPTTGKRVSRLNPREKWITTEVPELRILNDELWHAAKVRQGELVIKYANVIAGSRACGSRRSAILRAFFPMISLTFRRPMTAPAKISAPLEIGKEPSHLRLDVLRTAEGAPPLRNASSPPRSRRLDQLVEGVEEA